ncbi:hypothetical protein C3492_43570 [Streptomyces sp. Ru62]|uniref:hypothetical protein n=1 Tax=Actinomycetes TaxID=1760 RepID=UPI000CDD74C6|nr:MULTISPECIES: hypothetical protein [Actinomycetes]POX57452.1 hypothetical protein C3492_43570 [Streptomyces sp. Ru62]POX65569.1 hypothetical protein C3481_15915 [Microbacterium sp. Ru50]
MSTRRRLGTGPSTTTRSTTTDTAPRLLPVERAADIEDQEHADPHARSAGGPLPGRRKLGDRGQ